MKPTKPIQKKKKLKTKAKAKVEDLNDDELDETNIVVSPDEYDEIKPKLDKEDNVKIVDETNKVTKADLIEMVTGKKPNKVIKKKDVTVNEGLTYDENHIERMHPVIERCLGDRSHSLGNHPAFPLSEDGMYEHGLASKRFGDVVKHLKRNFGFEAVDEDYLNTSMAEIVGETMKLERPHKKTLQELAERLIREEFNIPEGVIEIDAKLVRDVELGDEAVAEPLEEMEYDSHIDIENMQEEVSKRRLINAMIQGGAGKYQHLGEKVNYELTEIEPTLVNNYGKLMSAADYSYWMNEDMGGYSQSAGNVTLDVDGEKPRIVAEAVVFPVLMHELAKGAMKMISLHGLPQDDSVREHVLSKCDAAKSEPWDMRLGPGLWNNFTEKIAKEDVGNKHQIYYEMTQLPAKNFNSVMKEVLAGTKKGKAVLAEMGKHIRLSMARDERDSEINERDDLHGLDLSGLEGL